METDRVRAAFDREVRRRVRPDGSGARIEVDRLVVRWMGTDGRGWSGIAWSDLDDADADAVIADQMAYFAARGEKFEWKLYDYDQPPDLGRRLLAAGFAAGGEESLMVAEVATVPTRVTLPPGVRLLPVTDKAGLDLLAEVHERVFGTDSSRLRRSLAAQLHHGPGEMTMVVAMAGDQPVSSARIEFLPGTGFASLWGGGTLPGWRGQGIYRALVAYRAQLATARGYRYLYVDASPDSQPILARLGFSHLARTTPYVWDPDGGAGGRRARVLVRGGGPVITLVIGSDAVGSDGYHGEVLAVVVDPAARTVTHLAVEPKGRQGLARLVPLDQVDLARTQPGLVRLSCTEAEFKNLPPAEETLAEFVPGYPDPVQLLPPGWRGGGVPATDGSAIPRIPEKETIDVTPPGEVEEHRGEHVHATDGDIGHLRALRIDPGSRQVTHVLIREGSAWDRKDVAIPAAQVAGFDNGIRLSLTRRQVRDLPSASIDHPTG